MAGKKPLDEKTNVMRLLDAAQLEYLSYCYIDSGAISGIDVADTIGCDRGMLFKTLVTVGKSGNHYVFVIPCAEELDLRKAASCVGEKNIEMVKSKELLALTGYIHGGCSPIGMKKQFATVVDETAQLYDKIIFSGGKIGYMVCMAPEDLKKMVEFKYEDLCV